MIDSAIYSKSLISENSEELNIVLLDTQKQVNKSTLYHLILSFAKSIYQQSSLLKVQKVQIVTEFGQNIGKNITEEQSLGNIKYFLVKQKEKNKPYLGQFKFFNIKIWPTIFGSNSKLFAIVGESGGYKLEDKDFGLIKWLLGEEQKVRALRKLLLQLSKGVIEGFLERFDLCGDVSYSEIVDNNINFEVKSLTKKVKTTFK